MTSSTSTRRYVCISCGRCRPAAEMIYSRYTGARYCRDVKACERRAARLVKHECPAPDCTWLVPPGQFACPTHWLALPPRLRGALLQAWQSGDVDEQARLREHCAEQLARIAVHP